MYTNTTAWIKNLPKNLIGFHELFDEFEKTFEKPNPNYPPYNIIEYEEGYDIEIAVAGFQKDDLVVKETRRNGIRFLEVSSKKKSEKKEGVVYRGIAERNFSLSFKLHSDLKVDEITLKNGLLVISFEYEETKNPNKTYTIND